MQNNPNVHGAYVVQVVQNLRKNRIIVMLAVSLQFTSMFPIIH